MFGPGGALVDVLLSNGPDGPAIAIPECPALGVALTRFGTDPWLAAELALWVERIATWPEPACTIDGGHAVLTVSRDAVVVALEDVAALPGGEATPLPAGTLPRSECAEVVRRWREYLRGLPAVP